MIASFVIGFHTARIDNLLQTMRFLVSDHREVIADSFIILLCQDDSETLDKPLLDELESLREQFHRSLIANMNLPCMQLPHLTNLGVKLAETDKVIILESDRLLPAGYFKSVINDLREGVSITCRNMKKLTQPTTDDQIRSGVFEHKLESRDQNNQIGVRNMWSGNTAIWRPDYYKAGKMDEAYIGYGWADSDMTNRMHQAGVQSIYRDEIELHLWHPSATYGEGDQKQMFIDNGLRYCKKWNVEFPDWFRQEMAAHKKVML
jgi:predicted glycosyltransferase involved in capsule biosynthesis